MLWRLLNKHWFIKRFVLVSIAGLIVALCAFVSLAQALEIMKPNPASAGSYITEIETCEATSTIGAVVVGTNSDGVSYWQQNTGGANINLYFYQSGIVPGCTDNSATASSTIITGLTGKKLWIFADSLQRYPSPPPYYNPLFDDLNGLDDRNPPFVSTFTVDGDNITSSAWSFASDSVKGLRFTPYYGGKIYLATITDEDLSTIDSQEKLYALIRSFSPVTTPHITSISPTSGPVGTLVTITGSNFGNTQGTSTVNFGSTAATVSSWSDTQIQATIPALVTDIYNVVVTTGTRSSNPVVFFIIGTSATDQQIFHKSFEFLSKLDLDNPLSQESGLKIAEDGFNAAHILAGPLQTAELHIRSENLVNLGMDLFRLITTIVKGHIDPLVPFGPLFICPRELFTCIIPDKTKPFTASTNELFEFNLAYQVNTSDLELFHIGDRYLLDSTIFSNQTFSIAEVTSITPSGIITFSFEGASVLTEIPIQIDIKPGELPNSINPTSNEKIPVAIISTRSFAAVLEVDRTSLTFGRTGDEHSLAFCNPNGEDVNRDGILDLVCHFYTKVTGFKSGDTQGIIKGQTVDYNPIHGVDSVRIVK